MPTYIVKQLLVSESDAEMTRVFNYFAARCEPGGYVEAIVRTVGVCNVEAIYIFGQYSSGFRAVSSADRNTPSLISLFSSLAYTHSLLLSPVSRFSVHSVPSLFPYKTSISHRFVKVSIPVAGFDNGAAHTDWLSHAKEIYRQVNLELF